MDNWERIRALEVLGELETAIKEMWELGDAFADKEKDDSLLTTGFRMGRAQGYTTCSELVRAYHARIRDLLHAPEDRGSNL